MLGNLRRSRKAFENIGSDAPVQRLIERTEAVLAEAETHGLANPNDAPLEVNENPSDGTREMVFGEDAETSESDSATNETTATNSEKLPPAVDNASQNDNNIPFDANHEPPNTEPATPFANSEPIGKLRGTRAGGHGRLPSIEYKGDRTTLFHYTTEESMNKIISSKKLFASKDYKSARYGDGQYFADITPAQIGSLTKQELTQEQVQSGMLSLGQLSSLFYHRGNLTSKITHYIEGPTQK